MPENGGRAGERGESRDPGRWWESQPPIALVGVLAGLVAALLVIFNALESRNGQASVLGALALVAVVGLSVVRGRAELPLLRRLVGVAMVLVSLVALGGIGWLLGGDVADGPTAADSTPSSPSPSISLDPESSGTAAPQASSSDVAEVETVPFTVEDVRLATWQDQGAEIGVALRGGDRAAYVVRVDVVQIALETGCGGQGSVDWVAVAAEAGLVADRDGSTVLVGKQRSSDSPGSTVEVRGRDVASRCHSSSSLTMRPQQPLAAEQLAQLRLRLPASFGITEVLYDASGSGDLRPATEVLTDPSVDLSPNERGNVERLLAEQDRRLFLWSWSSDFDESLFAGWSFVLLVSATLSDDSCAVFGVDLLGDRLPLPPAQAVDLLARYGDDASAACS